jgi:glutamyl/glutaminyl-tRNA synthetase
MSNEWDELNEELPAEDNTEKGIANLRKAYERKSKTEKELKEKLAQLESRERVRTLSEVLSAKGANAGLAKFYPADREGTQEKVEEWLTENAELFGHSPAPLAPTPAQVSPELRQMYEQFQTPGMNNPASTEVTAIQNYQFGDPMNSEQEMAKFLSFMRSNPTAIHNPGV